MPRREDEREVRLLPVEPLLYAIDHFGNGDSGIGLRRKRADARHESYSPDPRPMSL